MAKKIKSLEDLTPDVANANKGNERGIYMVETSLEKLGAGRSIVVDRDGNVIAGNKTLQAAIEKGFDIEVVPTNGKKLVVVQRQDLDLNDPDGQARQLAYADNRAGEVGLEWDIDRLVSDLAIGIELDDWFKADELDALIGDIVIDPPQDAGAQVDRASELQDVWQVERGQVWEIPSKTVEGKCHRVMCGDSTNAEDVEKLVNGMKIHLLFSDPPYGINIVKVGGATVGGSKEVTIGNVRSRHPYPFGGVKGLGTVSAKRVVGSVGANKLVDATMYRPVYGDDKPFDPSHLLDLADNQILFGGNYFASKLKDSRCWIVWDKNNTGYFADAELAWTSFDRGVKLYQHTWNGLVREGSRDLEGIKRMHPTQKPVGLFSNILQDFSESDHNILDTYLGSGTTLVACENVGRLGFGLEIDPAYVAVTLQRLSDMGLTPVKVED